MIIERKKYYVLELITYEETPFSVVNQEAQELDINNNIFDGDVEKI